jgi:hypothetical protein
VGSPAFKADTGTFVTLGVSTRSQGWSRLAYRRVTAHDARFAMVRGLFADHILVGQSVGAGARSADALLEVATGPSNA